LKLRQGADRKEISRRLQGVPGIRTVSDLSQLTTAGMPEVESKVAITVFLCGPSSALPSCGAKRTADATNGSNEVAKGGKGVTGAQKEDITRLIESMPEVESFALEDRAAAYEKSSSPTTRCAPTPVDVPGSGRTAMPAPLTVSGRTHVVWQRRR
jgi:hypothetical protein